MLNRSFANFEGSIVTAIPVRIDRTIQRRIVDRKSGTGVSRNCRNFAFAMSRGGRSRSAGARARACSFIRARGNVVSKIAHYEDESSDTRATGRRWRANYTSRLEILRADQGARNRNAKSL